MPNCCTSGARGGDVDDDLLVLRRQVDLELVGLARLAGAAGQVEDQVVLHLDRDPRRGVPLGAVIGSTVTELSRWRNPGPPASVFSPYSGSKQPAEQGAERQRRCQTGEAGDRRSMVMPPHSRSSAGRR